MCITINKKVVINDPALILITILFQLHEYLCLINVYSIKSM